MKKPITLLKTTILLILTILVIGGLYAQEQFKPGITGALRTYTLRLPLRTTGQEVKAEVIDNMVIYQGDIILGPLQRFEGFQPFAVVIDGNSFRWPGATIPYVITTGHAKTADINSAINMVNSSTNLRLIPKTSAHTDFIQFVSGSGCASSIGRQGNRQDVFIGPCSVGSIAHEILHAAGLFHEQSRQDRNDFINVNTENILEGKEHNFEREVSGASDIGPYNYGSIMHYGKKAFSKNGLNTIDIDVPPGTSSTTIGQRSSISAMDNAALNTIYYMLDVGESKTITIHANRTHNLTNIFMRAGQTYRFTTASREWNNGSRETDCNGYGGSILDRHGDINEMALTGEIFAQNNSNNYTGTYFLIGCGPRNKTITKSGFLVCFANDIMAAYGDNSRVVTLTVSRTQ